jgi:general secretion pathway protein C
VKIGGRQVAYIGSNPRENSPAVWIKSEGTLCQALLLVPQTTRKPELESGLPAIPHPIVAADPTGIGIAARIRRVGDSEFHLGRDVLDEILEHQLELLKSVRIAPERKDGDLVGIRLFGIRPGTLLQTLGFENGDRLESINGLPITSPETALRAYGRLRSASDLNVTLNRRGQTRSIDYRIK